MHAFLSKELASIAGNGKLGLVCEVFLLVQLSLDFLKIRKWGKVQMNKFSC